MLRKNVDVESGQHAFLIDGGMFALILLICASIAEEDICILLFRLFGGMDAMFSFYLVISIS